MTKSVELRVRCECCGQFIRDGDECRTADDVMLCEKCSDELAGADAAQRRGEMEEPA
jgi:hypothetical protein